MAVDTRTVVVLIILLVRWLLHQRHTQQRGDSEKIAAQTEQRCHEVGALV